MQLEVDRADVRDFTTDRRLTVDDRTGPEGVESAYRALREGCAEPDIGDVVSMHEGAFA